MSPANLPVLVRRVLVCDDDPRALAALAQLLEAEGLEAALAGSVEVAERELAARAFELVLAEPRSAERLLAQSIAPVVVTSNGNEAGLAALVDAGAWLTVGRPPRAHELRALVRAVDERERLRRELVRLRPAVRTPMGAAADVASILRGRTPAFVAGTPRMQEIVRTVERYAGHKQTVLVSGESGTGKELIARALHEGGPRASGPFVPVLCGAIPETLIESELFGHKKGAFTDATRDKLGLFEAAHGGTLFLDEVGELPLNVQVKLLRALQEERVRPVGAVEDLPVDVRVIAATMRDLPAMVAEGRFREDLFYRLNVLTIALPPLRERSEDLPALIAALITRHAARLRLSAPPALDDSALQLLLAYPWPGNVRELENTIERALVLGDGGTLVPDALPDKLRAPRATAEPTRPNESGLSIKKLGRALERELIRKALQQTSGNRTNAAKVLEISHRALLYKIKEYGLG